MRFFHVFLVQLLLKGAVRAKDTNEVLLRVVKNSLTRHLPRRSIRIGSFFDFFLENFHIFL